jgi:hypothetical protein
MTDETINRRLHLDFETHPSTFSDNMTIYYFDPDSDLSGRVVTNNLLNSDLTIDFQYYNNIYKEYEKFKQKIFDKEFKEINVEDRYNKSLKIYSK